MKNDNKTKILYLTLGIIIGVALTMLFQITILGNANKSIVKKVNTINYYGLAEDCLNGGGTAITNPNAHYGDDGVTYYPNGSFTCSVNGTSTTVPLPV
ncbi:MAG TPA: hypothetical protein PK685_04185 [archaeon]|nr:hypothetical protein [archaeon]